MFRSAALSQKAALQLPFAAATPLCENGFQESPQTFLKPEILNDFPLKMPKANAAGILNRLARWKSAFLARSFRQVCLDFPLKLC